MIKFSAIVSHLLKHELKVNNYNKYLKEDDDMTC